MELHHAIARHPSRIRKNLSFRPKQVSPFVLICLILITLFPLSGVAGGGAGGSDLSNELTQIQNGTATVTVTSGTTQGTVTVTFAPSYAPIVPRLIIVPNSVMSTTTALTGTNPTAFFQSGPTTTWTNMPAIDSEIYSDANAEHRIEINLSGESSFRFGVNCVSPSNTVGAYLTIEYLSAGVWTELNSAQRFLIDAQAGSPSCPGGNASHLANTVYASIPSAAKGSAQQLRVDGVGGGGVGDIPSFSSLWIEWSSTATGNNAVNVGNTASWRACASLASCVASPPVETSPTGFIIAVTYPIAPTSTQTLKFTWKAGVIA